MARTSQDGTDRTEQVLQGLHQLVEAGRVAEVEAVLTTLIESEPASEESVEERETRSYAEGMRDGIALARRLGSTSDSTSDSSSGGSSGDD